MLRVCSGNRFWCVLQAALVIATWVLVAPGAAAKSTVTIATYDQQYRYQLIKDELLPKWEEKFPDIDIEVVYYPDFWNKLITMMATDSAPDIVDTAGTQLFAHVVRGGAVDLAPFVERYLDSEDWFPRLWEEARYPFPDGNEIYEIPYSVVGGVLYYHTQIFSRSGVAPPDENWTWEDFAAAASKLTRRESADVTTTWGTTVAVNNVFFDPLVRSFGANLLTPDRKHSNLGSDAARDALEWMVQLAQVDRSAAFPTKSFTDGDVGMAIDGSWRVKYVDWQDLPFEYGVAMVPQGPVARSVYGGSNGWEVMKRPGQDLEAVWKVLNELVSPEPMRLLATKYTLPARRSLAQDWATSGPISVLIQETSYFHDGEWTPNWTGWQAAQRNELNRALSGEIDPGNALIRAEQAVNAVLDRAYDTGAE